MANRLDWPRYSRWTWVIAIIIALILLWMWFTGRGPGSAASCCAPMAVTQAPTAPVASPSSASPAPVAHTANWDGNKLTLEGLVPNEAIKTSIVNTAKARYGADNVIDKLTVDAAAKGPISVTLRGQVVSDAVRTQRGEEAKGFYPNARIDNQLTVAAAPAAKAEDVQCGDKVAVAATFATGSANLTPEARKLLDAVVPCITGPFEVSGHTDNVGKSASNQALSERRAQSVAKYLASKGVDAMRLTAKGYGDTQPIGDNATVEGKAKNRRIEFKKM